MDPKAYWVGFNLVKGIGAVRLQALLDRFGDLASAWKAPAEDLRGLGLPTRSVEALMQIRRQVDLERIWEKTLQQGIKVITWQDEDYPRLLIEIDQPPPVIYLRGELLPCDENAVAVVGTRRVTAYGRQVTEELCAFLAQHSITMVSGLARGVDACGHQAALRAGGRTLAVLGSGVDVIYPPEHRRMAEEIAVSGAVISDYPPGTPPESSNFPPRNRIISGLSKVSVVIEAGDTSGALITASFAANQGRDVMAVPGPIYAPNSRGTNRLIRDGARPLLRPEDILDMLNYEQTQSHQAARLVIPADAVEASLMASLDSQPRHIDEICQQAGLPIEKVSATLTLMELKGMVRQVGGMNYVTVREGPANYGETADE